MSEAALSMPQDIDVGYPEHGEAEGIAAPHLPSEGGARVLLCFATHDVVRQSRNCRPYRLSMEGADLSLLNSGRAPLLADHERHISAILGVIETAWIDEALGSAFAIARFAPTQRGQEAQALVAAGMLSNCSMGFSMSPQDGEEGGDVPISRWWRPFEITLCPVPANWHSNVKVAPVGVLGRQVAEASAARAKAMRDAASAQRAQERQALTACLAPRLADRLQIDPILAAQALAEAMGAEGTG